MDNQHTEIQRIIVSIKPENYIEPNKNELCVLDIEIRTEINVYRKQEILPRDVLKSQFDLIIESAKKEIKHYMLND